MFGIVLMKHIGLCCNPLMKPEYAAWGSHHAILHFFLNICQERMCSLVPCPLLFIFRTNRQIIWERFVGRGRFSRGNLYFLVSSPLLLFLAKNLAVIREDFKALFKSYSRPISVIFVTKILKAHNAPQDTQL